MLEKTPPPAQPFCRELLFPEELLIEDRRFCKLSFLEALPILTKKIRLLNTFSFTREAFFETFILQ